MIYRLFRALAHVALSLFFRRIEVEARHNAPAVGPVLFVPNHSNALVDPLFLVISLRRRLTLTAKNVLGKNPLARWLMASLGMVTFHRRSDVGKGADLRENVKSLQQCRHVLAGGGAICIFPEGVSHSDPSLRRFHLGPARIALDFVHKDGNPGRLRIVPVGLLYTDKDRFRSGVWLRYGVPLDVARWAEAHPEGGPVELTEELQRRVGALTLNFKSRRESAILSWAAEIVATGARDPRPLGAAEAPLADWFRLQGRLQAGYQRLEQHEPETLKALATRIRLYRAELKRDGIAAEEVYLPLHPGRAAFFVVRELELVLVGASIALFGAINHLAPYLIVKKIARTLSTDKDHWASNVVFPGVVVFPLCYLVQLTAAWCLLPAFWAGVYTVALPFTGYYALLFGDRLGRTWRRLATFLRFLVHPDEQRRLAAEGRAILDQVREVGARLEAESVSDAEPDGEGDGDDGRAQVPANASTGETDAGPRFAMSASDLEAQYRDDILTVREVVAGLGRLETEWEDARRTVQARTRGYFTPEEDDRVRRLLLAYRNYRLVLYEIIRRYLDHEQLDTLADQVRGFLIGYAAGLLIHSRSMRLIEAYENDPLIRKKLNEPDAKFGLDTGFFDEIVRAYTSLTNYRILAGCSAYWRRHRRDLHALGLDVDPDWSGLTALIRRERMAVGNAFWHALRHRLRFGAGSLTRSISRPVHDARYGLRAYVAGTLGTRHTTPWYEPSLRPEILARLHPLLVPGDVLLTRSEHKITTALLPGFWCHSALYVGHCSDLETLGIERPGLRGPHRDAWGESGAGAPYGYVIEAISPKVLVNPLEKCLRADHVVVLRPNLSDEDRRAAVAEAFRHVGKAYDFEFDFNVTTRLVCTELIYRSYQGRGTIALPLTKRLGRYTLTGDDIMGWFLDQLQAAPDPGLASFRVVALVLRDAPGQARFVSPDSILDVLRALHSGARPGSLRLPEPCPASSLNQTYREADP